MKSKMFARICVLVLLVVNLISVSGCSTISGWWKDAQDSVDPVPSIDLKAGGIKNPDNNKLALLFTPVDRNILKLKSYLSNVDNHPNEEWFSITFMKFPWISGVFTVDDKASLLVSKPENPIKPFEPGPLVEYEGDWNEVELKTFINYSELGPEMYMCTPFFKDAEFRGLVIVHFDPRILLRFCPEPEKLIVFHPDGGGVWTLGNNINKDQLKKADWDTLLAENVNGYVKVGGKRYVWFSRYIGDERIVYLTDAVSKESEDDGFLFF